MKIYDIPNNKPINKLSHANLYFCKKLKLSLTAAFLVTGLVTTTAQAGKITSEASAAVAPNAPGFVAQGFGGWNLDNIEVIVNGTQGPIGSTNLSWYDESNGAYNFGVDSDFTYAGNADDGAGTVMGQTLAKDWPVGEPSGIKIVNDDLAVKDPKPTNCIMATSYLVDHLLDSTDPQQVPCSGPFQSHKRYKLAMLPTTVDGIGSESVDLVFNVEAESGSRDYQVFQKINNWTDGRLEGFTIQVGFGVGTAFQTASGAGQISNLYLTVPSDIWAPTQLANFSEGLFGPFDDKTETLGFFDPVKRAGFLIDEYVVGEPVQTDTLTATTTLGSDYAQIPPVTGPVSQFGPWLPDSMLPYGVFFDDDGNPETDAQLLAWYGFNPDPAVNALGWMGGSQDSDGAFSTIPTAEILVMGQNLSYTMDFIDDLVNVGLNYIVTVDDISTFPTTGTFTIRITPTADTSGTEQPAYVGVTPSPSLKFTSSDADVLLEPNPEFIVGTLLTARVGDADLNGDLLNPDVVTINISSDSGLNGTLQLIELGNDRGVFAATLPGEYSNVPVGTVVTMSYLDENTGIAVNVPKTFSSTAINDTPPILTLSIPIGAGSDDAEESLSSGRVSLDSSDLELTQDGSKQQVVGLRFPLDIPQGATILNAFVQFTTDEISLDPLTTLSVSGQATANAQTFSGAIKDISERLLTDANVSWIPKEWTVKGEAGPDQATPDLSTIVQEVVNQGDWAEGNAIAIIISGEGKREAESFDGTAAPLLYVEFSTVPPTPEPPVAVDDDAVDAPAYTTGVNQSLIVPNGVDDIVERNDSVGFPEAVIVSSDSNSSEGGTVAVSPDGSFNYTPDQNYEGIDSFSYTLSNGVNPDSTATVYIEVKAVVDLTHLWLQVLTSSDDAEERLSSGSVKLTSSDLELIQDGTYEQMVGVRFQALNIPQGANIVEAYIQYTTDEVTTDPTNLTVYGQSSGNALTFNDVAYDISSRELTSANVQWMPPSWTVRGEAGPDQATPDLSVIVQQVVNRADWMAGNSIAFITVGSGKRVAEAFNGTAVPELHISFSSEPPADQEPDAIDDGTSISPAFTTGIDQELIVSNGTNDIVERNDNVGFPAATVTAFDSTSAEGGDVVVNPDGSFSYTPATSHVGIDSFNYTLTNLAGTDSAKVYIGVINSAEVLSLSIPVGTGTDDAEEDVSDGDMYLSSSDLELIQDRDRQQKVGLRFPLNIPAGAIIINAYIQFTADEISLDPTVLSISGQDTADALTFTNLDYDISNRMLISATVPWTPATWTSKGEAGPDQATPDLSIIVQSLVNQTGWLQGNSIVIIISGEGMREAESFDGTAAPVLHVEYLLPGV